MKTLNQLRDEIHEYAINKGFWDKERETGTLLMLCVSELAEAMEADRINRYARLIDFDLCMCGVLDEDFEEQFIIHFRDKIKDSMEDELADSLLRILDLCGALDIDIEKHVELKMKYNATRERMHGKKY